MMIQGFTKSRLALALTLAIGASSMAYAADNTSAMRGTILGPDGQPAPNTKIMLIHQPSGTVTEVTTNEDGIFNASGLRVGGPYEVIIDSDVYQDATKEDIFLSLNQTFRLNEQLQPEGSVEKITVVGNAMAYSANAGSSSNFNAEDIANAPSFNRDLKDVMRENPLVTTLGGSSNEMTVAGQNPRFNSISVDGIAINDDFGLNGNGYPTQRSPVSIDAIDQIAVETNPYNPKFSGFTGAGINAVTKSGTNEFHGSLMYEKTSDSWAGKAKNPNTGVETDVEGIDSDTYGFTLGGPLIKDKLFFFLSHENYSTTVTPDWGASGSGKANETLMSEETFNTIRDYTLETYGVDIGDWDTSADEKNKTTLVKLDWNITDTQRASFSYNTVKSNSVNNMTSSRYTLKPSSNWYNTNQDMDTYSFQLYSDWTPDFSTQFSLAYKDVDTANVPGTYAMGTVIINNTEGDDGAGIQFGPDTYRHANALRTKTWTAKLDGDYLMGDHKLGFGVQYDSVDIFNLFVYGSLGVWTFDTLDDYLNGNVYTYTYHNSTTNDANDAAANFKMGTYAAYISDEFAIRPDLDITYGVRYERIWADDKPTYNESFYDRYGFSNQENLDGKDIWLPRVGLTWYATDALTVRGGIGRFSGGKPNVWISNSFSVDGVSMDDVSDYYYKNDGESQYGVTSTDITSVDSIYQNELTAADGETDAIDPDFKIPSVWKSSLGFDYNFDIPHLGEGYTWHAEFIYNKNQDDATWVDLNRYDTGETTSDGRIIYAQKYSDHTYDIMLTNADEDGSSRIFTTSLTKSWDNGIDMSVSYTHQNIKEGNFGTSSQAASNWKYNHMINRNDSLIGTGYYEIEHSFKLTLGYSHEFFPGYATKINAYLERRSGMPYSWLMGGAYKYSDGTYLNSDANAYQIGDETGVYGYYTPYIPTGPDDPNVTYADGLDYETFMEDYVKPAGLAKYAGGYVPKMSGRTPWRTITDISFTQEVPGFAKGHKGMFYLTVENFANLLNKDWGTYQYASYGYKTLINANYLSDGTLVYSPYSSFSTENSFDTEQSTWYLKMGVKYTF